LPDRPGRILAIGLWTLVLSAALSSSSGALAGTVNIGFSIAALIAIISAGILFDIIGTAATAASEAPINAMAANRVYGAPEALGIVRNAPAVANFCNDFVGDICGTVSGAVGATIAISAALAPGTLLSKFASTAVIALISAVTVAGKATGKRFAIESANSVMLAVGRTIATFHRLVGGGGSAAPSRSGGSGGPSKGNGRSDRSGRNGGDV
jgi:hypothetical protein